MLVAGLLSSCGAGVAAVVASSGSSGGGNSAASIANLQVPVSRTSPARIRFELSDREGETVRVELLARVKSMSDLQLLTAVGGPDFPANGAAIAVPAGNQVRTVDVDWRFPEESFLPDDGHFVEDVELVARLESGAELVLGDDEPLSLGNDAPAVGSVTPIVDAEEGEAAGIVRIQVAVGDSSDDVVTVLPEFDVQGDVPDAGWQPATGFGLSNVRVSRNGTLLDFFWDTDTDLHDLEREVKLRFRPTDFALTGEAVESAQFRVDNNAAPIVQLDSGPLILNPDERRGIPIPFRVIDEEGDLVEVIFQWRHEGEEFPSLDRDGNGKIENAEVDEILADKELRQQFHVCTPYPHFAQGRVVPIDENTVRLPELASSESWILASGIVGKTLELLRPSSIPAPITPAWRENPLVSPIAALPVGDGLTALVLDVPGNGRLREIELAAGKVVREIATLPGIPSTMAFEKREKALIIALDDAGTWRIDRVELATGAITELIASDGTEPAPVRGIASRGTHAAVFTAGASVFHLDYRDPLVPQLGRLLTDLATPWGIAVDPLRPDRLYVSERDANRVLALELDSHGKLTVVVKTAELQPTLLEAPESLALERNASRLLIATSSLGGGRQLTGLDLGAAGANRSYPIGSPAPKASAGLATGPEGLRLVCLPTSSELLVAGGAEQRRSIVARSASSPDITVAPALDPVPGPGRPWRIRAGSPRFRASTAGASGRFLWNGTDSAGSVLLRAVARDDELGPAVEGTAPKRVRAGIEVDPLVLGGPGTTDTPNAVTAADLDGDGDLDLISANNNQLTVFFQLTPGSFSTPPLVLGGPGTTDLPAAVTSADLDGDGDLDLVSANAISRNLTVFFQSAPGSFDPTPLILGDPVLTHVPGSVAAADLDGDGDLDLASGNTNGNTLTVFFQVASGDFDPDPLVLGGPGTTDSPSVAAADLDGDGDVDLVSANGNSDNLTIFFQLAPGSFATPPLVVGGHGTMDEPASVAAADLDEDGDLDLVSPNFGGGNLTVFFQLTPGNFATAPLVLGNLNRFNVPGSVQAADLDEDGDLDLVGPQSNGDGVLVFPQLSPGSFANTPLLLAPGTLRGPSRVLVVDIDQDGHMDLVAANNGASNLAVFSQTFRAASTPVVLGGVGTTFRPRSVAAADLDGDGDLDLVSANESSRNLTIFWQELSGRFADAPQVLGVAGTLSMVHSVAAADLDSDGDLDLAAARRRGRLAVFFQRSPGGFAETPLSLEAEGLGPSVATADLDGDGDVDLVSAGTDSLVAFHQLSPGSFESSVLGGMEMTFGPRTVVVADIEADGDLDLVSSTLETNSLTTFFQTAPGSFAAVPIATTVSPVSIAAADFDGDGDLDLASTNANDTLTVFFQSAPRSFSSSPLVLGGPGTTDGPSSVAVSDIDGDGDQDLVSGNRFNLTVFFHLSPGTFGPTPLTLGNPSTTDLPAAVAAADIDGDGDQDIVSANGLGNNLTVFFGGR